MMKVLTLTVMDKDKFKRDESVHRTYAVLAEMTGQPSQRFAKLARRDMAVCEAVFGLFFG